MKIISNTVDHLDALMETYGKTFIDNGFSLNLFPELTIGVNINDVPADVLPISHPNNGLQHYSDSTNYCFVSVMTDEEIVAAQMPLENYKKAMPGAFSHEVGHHIHMDYIDKQYQEPQRSLMWEKANAISGGKVGKDFRERYQGEYWYIRSWENFANYFESIIEGRIKNDAFLSFVCELIGLKRIKLTKEYYFIEKDEKGEDRAFIPVRKVAESLGCRVDYNENTGDVYVFLADKTVRLTRNEYKLAKDNEGKDRSFLPIRKVAERLGFEVNYITETGDIFVLDVKNCKPNPSV